MPEPDHNDGTLKCVYEQYDDMGNVIYPDNEDHLQMKVHYVLEPREETLTMPAVKVPKYLINISECHLMRTFLIS